MRALHTPDLHSYNRVFHRQRLREMREEAAPERNCKEVESMFAFGIVTMIAMGAVTAVTAGLLKAGMEL